MKGGSEGTQPGSLRVGFRSTGAVFKTEGFESAVPIQSGRAVRFQAGAHEFSPIRLPGGEVRKFSVPNVFEGQQVK